MKHLLIDGGYLSFLIGSNPYTYELFMRDKPYQEYLWLMDGSQNYRKDIFPEYKAHRKRGLTEKQKETRKRVYKIREMIQLEYPKMFVHSKLEADDLIALMHYRHPNVKFRTLGNDKDMLVISDIEMIGMREQSAHHYQIAEYKAAKAIKPYLNRAIDLLFYQSLFGDKTDNIPRILPNRRYDIMRGLMDTDTPFQNAYDMFGEAWLTNLKLVILPYPDVLERDNLIEALDIEYQYNEPKWVHTLGIGQELRDNLTKLLELSKVETTTKHLPAKHNWLNDLVNVSELSIIEGVLNY